MRISCRLLGALGWGVLACACGLGGAMRLGAEEVFPVLEIGTQRYTDVKVTTKAKDYIFILHSAGMNNIKVSELSEDVREKLGYAPPKPVATTNQAAVWAGKTLAAVHSPQVKALEQRVQATWSGDGAAGQTLQRFLVPKILIAAGVLLLFAYLFRCHCFKLICRKAGRPGGLLVWLPVLQLIPLFRAARMSGWWFLTFLLLVLYPLTAIVWSFKIVKARGKHWIWGLLLLLPVTDSIAIAYLAFSDPEETASGKLIVRMPSISLETA